MGTGLVLFPQKIYSSEGFRKIWPDLGKYRGEKGKSHDYLGEYLKKKVLDKQYCIQYSLLHDIVRHTS
jgi:hypothetical protein